MATIYRAPGFVYAEQKKGLDGLVLTSRTGRAGISYLSLKDGRISYEDVDGAGSKPYPCVERHGVNYWLYQDGDFDIETVRSGKMYFIDSEGRKLDLSHELIYAYALHSQSEDKDKKQFVDSCLDYRDGVCSVLYIDLESETIVDRELSVSPTLIDGQILAVSRVNAQVLRLNQKLETVWVWKYSGTGFFSSSGSARCGAPIEYDDSVLVYLGHLDGRVTSIEGRQCRYNRRGSLYSFAKSDGAVRWHRELDWSVEDMVFDGDRLYISTGDSIEVIDPATGSVLSRVSTGFAIPEHRGTTSCLAALHLEGGHLFYLPLTESRLLVYDIDSLTLRKEVTLPDGWCPKEFQLRDERSNTIYFGLQLGKHGAPDYHRHAILALRTDDLDAPVQMESAPSTTIELRPSATEPGKEEVWIEMQCSSLDDAFRFGELYTQNQAYIQGWNASISHCPPNPKFNGKIHFRYSGCELPAEIVRKRLEIFNQRFASWNSAEEGGFYSYAGDGSKRLCTLDVEYIE